MATADEVLAHLGVTFAGVEENQKQVDTATTGIETTVTNISQARSTAEDLATQSQTMGFEDKVAIIQAAINKTNEAQSQFNAAKQSLNSVVTELNGASNTLREAEQLVQSLKALTAPSVSARVGPPAHRPHHIPDRYPWGRPHTLAKDRLDHVCFGDPNDHTSGGHLFGTKRKKKTEFPSGWTPADIGKVLRDVADHPHEVIAKKENVWHAKKLVKGVWVVAVVHDDFRISAGWPKSLPRIDQDQRRKGVTRRGRRRTH